MQSKNKLPYLRLMSNHHACQQSMQHQRAVRQKACGTSAFRDRAWNKTLYPPPPKLTLCLCSFASCGHPVPLSMPTPSLTLCAALPVAATLFPSPRPHPHWPFVQLCQLWPPCPPLHAHTLIDLLCSFASCGHPVPLSTPTPSLTFCAALTNWANQFRTVWSLPRSSEEMKETTSSLLVRVMPPRGYDDICNDSATARPGIVHCSTWGKTAHKFVCCLFLKGKKIFEDVTLVEVMYLVFARMPGESYCRWLRSLLLYLC